MIKDRAIETLKIEAEAIENLIPRVDDEFIGAVEEILHCTGRIVVTGMGKSGHVGKKIAATLASTGTPAFFLHPAEAYHGDMGMVTDKDIVLAISNSGESSEVVNIIPVIRRIGAKIIAMCGRKNSSLGKNSDYFINIGVEREACTLGLAPTASTTATLAMGDAIAMALMDEKKFTSQDYALFHPGGALGRKLLLTVGDVMHRDEENPVLKIGATAKDAIFEMTAKGLGAVSIADDNNKFVGIVTDGIIRRAIDKNKNFIDEPVENIMYSPALTIEPDKLAAAALSVMEKHKPRPVTVLPVIDKDKNILGMIHLTDLLRQGIV